MPRHRIIMNVIIASLIGMSLALMIKATRATHDIQSNTVFLAELSDNVLPGQVMTAETLLKELDFIQDRSVSVISASSALQEMKEDMPELTYLADNPFRDMITFRINVSDKSSLTDLTNEVKGLAGVEEVYYDSDFLKDLSSTSAPIRVGVIIICLIFLIGSIAILALRVRRDVISYLKEVEILSLAGAEEGKIIEQRRAWSIKWGAISAIGAALITVINIIFINNTLLDGLEITFLQSIIAIVVMSIIVLAIHGLVTQRSMTTHFARLNPSIKS